MTQRADIAEELDCLKAILTDIKTIAARTDSRRRNDLVEMRRRLGAQIAFLGEVAEPYFTQRGDQHILRDYREQFSKMRAATALHQARWPAVMLGERHDDDYVASALRVHRAHDDFIAWVRSQLDQPA